MRGRQRIGVVAEMVLAELAGVVAEIEQELGERRGARPQIGRAAWKLGRNHAGAQRMHAREEGVAPCGAALLGIIMREDRAFIADAIDVGRLADHQATMVDARLVKADVVAHDEEDVGFLCRLLRTAGVLAGPDSDIHIVALSSEAQDPLYQLDVLRGGVAAGGGLSGEYAIQHGIALPFYDASVAPRLMHRKPR